MSKAKPKQKEEKQGTRTPLNVATTRRTNRKEATTSTTVRARRTVRSRARARPRLRESRRVPQGTSHHHNLKRNRERRRLQTCPKLNQVNVSP